MSGPALVLAIPSKGDLHEKTLGFLAACGVSVKGGGQGREYVGHLAEMPDVGVLFLRADEIPERIERGGVHLGITGEDLYRERAEGAASYVLLRELGYGHARVVVAVPRAWIDVSSVLDLEEVAMLTRQRRGRALRVATKFPRLARGYFAEHGVTDYVIVHSLGATEGAPASGAADIIVDISSTGATLAQNHLKEIEGGTLINSQACLIASTRTTDWTDPAFARLAPIVERIESRRRAEGTRVLRAVVPELRAPEIAAELTHRLHCDVRRDAAELVPAAPEQSVGITAVCPKGSLDAAVACLRSGGAGEVVVSPAEFLFGPASAAVEGFRHLLKRRPETPKTPLGAGPER